MTDKQQIRQSPLFSALQETLTNRIPAIKEQIEQSVAKKGYDKVLIAIDCKLDHHLWGKCRNGE